MSSSQTRRTFLKASAAFTLTACSAANGAGDGSSNTVPDGPHPGAPRAGEIKLPPGGVMPTRALGKTGVTVSLLGIGGYHIGLPSEDEGIRIIRMAIDHGVTFLDNCWDYNEGKSEERMGKALQDGYRKRAFLMTKLDGRTREAATAQLEQSLRRLRTDVIDLVQIHEVIRATDPARVFGPGGAVEALLEAKKAGKIRFIGFTGHKDPQIHLGMLKAAADHGFAFDTVQMPLNVMDAHYRSFEREVLPVLVERGIGPLGMKPFGSGIFFESGAVQPIDCLHYPMNLPTSVVITGCDTVGVLEQALFAAYTFQPLSAEEVAAILVRTKAAAAQGRYEKFKTTEDFDGTAKHPEWLESAKI